MFRNSESPTDTMSALTIQNLAISGETDRPLESHQTTPARRRMSGRSGFPDYTRRRSLAGGFSPRGKNNPAKFLYPFKFLAGSFLTRA